VLAAIAISLAQARAAWVALSPGRPISQRIVAGFAAALLVSISITALASHVLDAQRAKGGRETAASQSYSRAKAAHDKVVAEMQSLGETRPVSVIQAEIASAQIDMVVWRRSAQCSDISREDTKKLCGPILTLYKERGAAARKLELEPEVAHLREQLSSMTPPVEAKTASEEAMSMWWAWIMGLGVVYLATFGSVIYANEVTVTERELPNLPPPPSAKIVEDDSPPSGGECRPKTREEALADLRQLLKAGHSPPSQEWLRARWQVGSKGTVSKWLRLWEDTAQMPGSRMVEGRCKTVVA
jgi:hypothetical protein